MKTDQADQILGTSAEPILHDAISPEPDVAADGRTMLLVDDSFAFRERLARALVDRGFEVETAANYDQAMQLAQTFRPRMAVVDLRMPGRSGLELIRDLKQRDSSIQVLMLSGFGSITTAVEAVRLGAVNFLPKPVDADDIMAAFDRDDNGSVPSESNDHSVPSLARAEWEHIYRVLADCGGNVSDAARRLGIHRRSLQRKLNKRAPD
jgi:two-component system response regulator RegA